MQKWQGHYRVAPPGFKSIRFVPPHHSAESIPGHPLSLSYTQPQTRYNTNLPWVTEWVSTICTIYPDKMTLNRAPADYPNLREALIFQALIR
jgi:hypothetical protein